MRIKHTLGVGCWLQLRTKLKADRYKATLNLISNTLILFL